MSKSVYVGMSGGVDSSVAAGLLVRAGYQVTGVYMKNWSQDLPGHKCPWQEDYEDAKRVAVKLGIDFKLYDFETEYRQKVVDYMVREYKAGLTPNPDIMCNQEIKFGLFLKTAIADGADLIATGHYARTADGRLLTAKNTEKDQTYFLYRVTEEALRKALFPLGDFTSKDQVRRQAADWQLPTATKKDSQGICFVGEVGIKDFLLHELGPQKPGEIIDQAGDVIGQHEGAIFYTIGQRHGLKVGSGLPYYITGKNMTKNQVFVTTDLQDQNLWRKKIPLVHLNFINRKPESGKTYQIRLRYRADLTPGTIEQIGQDSCIVDLKHEARAVTPGQSAVIYDKDMVLGGGIIA